jgi:hypothetical protein
MAFVLSEFTSTPANIVADIKTKVLLSSDWSNPTGSVLQATTPLGATMAVDLVGGGAADNLHMKPKFWRLFSAGSGTDAYQRYIYWSRNGNSISSSSTLHVRVTAGSTLLYVEIEGPQAGESGADASQGSWRQAFFIAQMTPYFVGDTVPAVVAGGSGYTNNESQAVGGYGIQCAVSRNQANTAPWVMAKLASLSPLDTSQAGRGWTYQPVASDGNTYLLPYVVFEDVAGIRGRLTDLFFAGYPSGENGVFDTVANGLAAGQQVTFGGNTYKITAPYRNEGQSGNTWFSGGSLGMTNNQNNPISSVLAAIRVA